MTGCDWCNGGVEGGMGRRVGGRKGGEGVDRSEEGMIGCGVMMVGGEGV